LKEKKQNQFQIILFASRSWNH